MPVQFCQLFIAKPPKRTFVGDNQFLTVAVGSAAIPDIQDHGPVLVFLQGLSILLSLHKAGQFQVISKSEFLLVPETGTIEK